MTTEFLTSSNLSSADSQRVFRAILDAAASPGRPTSIVITGRTSALPPAAFPALALADIEVTFAVYDDGDTGVGEWAATTISHLTGARRTIDLADADMVVALSAPSLDAIRQIRRGDAAAPEAGARLFLACDRIVADARASDTDGVRIWIRGPGAASGRRVDVYGLVPEVFESIHDINTSFRAGIDVWLIDAAGSVVGMPRSSQLEIVAARC